MFVAEPGVRTHDLHRIPGCRNCLSMFACGQTTDFVDHTTISPPWESAKEYNSRLIPLDSRIRHKTPLNSLIGFEGLFGFGYTVAVVPC